MKVKSPEMLALLMETHGYTCEELAARVGVSKSTIGHLRNPNSKRTYVKPEVAKKIAKVLKIKRPADLFEVETSTVYAEVPGYKKARKAA